MGDIFYFAGRRHTPARKSHSHTKNGLKACKRGRGATMNFHPQHACVARIEEPTFCPSNLSSLIPQYPYADTLQLSAYTREDETRPAGCSNDDEVEQSNIIATPHRREETSLSASSQIPLQLRHRPPELNRSWEEESRRRLHSPLPSIVDGDRVRSRLAQQADESAQHALTSRPRSSDVVSEQYDVQNEASPFNGPMPTYVAEIESEGLPVDDPRRSYDFAEFMERWSPQSTMSNGILDSNPGSQPILLTRGSATHITAMEMQEQNVDMQGLRWDNLAASRQKALQARKVFHPSNRESVSSCVEKETEHPRIDCNCYYRFRSFSPSHRAHVSHYQLRNVLTASGRNDIFYANDNQVMQASLTCPSNRNAVMKLSNTSNSASGFRITCLSTSPRPVWTRYRSDNVLLAGGFYGEYAMLDLSSEIGASPTVGFVTHEYNGLVTHIHLYSDRPSGLARAVFTSNDCKLRVMDTRTARFINTRTYDTAINCSAPSPDGRLRILVGDSEETYITDADKGHILVTLKQHTDHGFACNWSNDGRLMATGAQDGKAIVWDARNWTRPLQDLQCATSCARSLHFTDDRALIVAEEDDVVSIYNTRCFDRYQDIQFFGSIAGVGVLDGGAEIVVANADRAVGGLLSFSRTASGLNDGTYGQQLHEDIEGRRICWRSLAHNRGYQRQDFACVSNVFV